MHLLANLLLVIQDQRQLVVSRVQADRLPCKHKETLLANFRFVIAGREIMQGETPGRVGFHPIGAPSGIFEPYLRGCNWDPILVQNDT